MICCDVKRRTVIGNYWRFGQIYCPCLQGGRVNPQQGIRQQQFLSNRLYLSTGLYGVITQNLYSSYWRALLVDVISWRSVSNGREMRLHYPGHEVRSANRDAALARRLVKEYVGAVCLAMRAAYIMLQGRSGKVAEFCFETIFSCTLRVIIRAWHQERSSATFRFLCA